jgi:spermidine synthase
VTAELPNTAAFTATWLVDEQGPGDLHLYRRLETRVRQQTPYQQLEISRLATLGWCLILDGKVQSAEVDEQVYHELLVHPALTVHPEPRRVLILGGGEGATLREALRHPTVERAVMVDIDEAVVQACRVHLPGWHAGAFDDPRAQLVFADAEAFLRASTDRYDVVIGDLTDPGPIGPAAQLYRRAFFELVASRLAPGGVYVTQTGGLRHPFALAPGRMLARLLAEVLPVVVPYAEFIPSFDYLWLFLLAGRFDRAALRPEAIARRLAERGLRLRYYGALAHQRAFSLPFWEEP